MTEPWNPNQVEWTIVVVAAGFYLVGQIQIIIFKIIDRKPKDE